MQLDLGYISYVIFDMDGVITDTAGAHASAWKKMFDEYLKKIGSSSDDSNYRPFDADKDYRRYVDGKPRYDGVKSFLDSRGISLPYGAPNDDPDKETICGLGNRKNLLFVEHIRGGEVRKYDSSVDLVKRLKANGVRTAIISASRNAVEVLKAARVSYLFDTKVDGVDSDRLKLKGKPEPDIFLQACKQLGARSSEAAIVEDSLAGVEAGKNGGFGIVIGVDRVGWSEEMRKRGADIIVEDLSELQIARKNESEPVVSKAIRSIPSALKNKQEIFKRLKENTPVIFLDYDGTLTL
jgi:trehalose 6-phosphate phosphatase